MKRNQKKKTHKILKENIPKGKKTKETSNKTPKIRDNYFLAELMGGGRLNESFITFPLLLKNSLKYLSKSFLGQLLLVCGVFFKHYILIVCTQ